MVKVYKYGISYIIDNKDNIVDIKLLSKVMNDYLKKLGEIKESDEMTRCLEHDHFIILGAYGSLHGRLFYDFIRSYFIATNCKFSFRGHFIATDDEFKYDNYLPESIYQILKDRLTRITNYRRDQCGGGIKDTKGLDEGVNPLCDALSHYSFVKTFSSCEGHNTGRSNSIMYVLFTIEGKERFYNLNRLTTIIDKSFEKAWTDFDLKDVYIKPQFFFNKGHWPNVNGVYFEIRIEYGVKHKEKLFEIIKYIGKLIKGEEI